MANVRNYQKELEKTLEQIGREGQNAFSFSAQLLRPLQQLCAGVSLRYFSDHGILLQSQYLSPEDEYRKRVKEQQQLISGNFRLLIPYLPGGGLRALPDFMRRCGGWRISGKGASGALPATGCGLREAAGLASRGRISTFLPPPCPSAP